MFSDAGTAIGAPPVVCGHGLTPTPVEPDAVESGGNGVGAGSDGRRRQVPAEVKPVVGPEVGPGISGGILYVSIRTL